MTTSAIPYTKGLHQVGDAVWAWLAPDGGFGLSNAGLVRGTGRALLVDTLFDLPLTRQMLDAMGPITDEAPITDLVNTHANGDHCFGNQLLSNDVTIHATAETVHEMHEAPPELMTTMAVADLGPVLTPYVRKRLEPFDFTGITIRDPDALIEGATTLDIGGRQVDVTVLGPAHTEGDVVVNVPDAGVLFTGDLLFVGGAPIMWAGPIENWIAACDTMIGWNPSVVVPGHGPITDVDGIAAMRDYLVHVDTEMSAALRAGKDWKTAVWDIDLGPFDALSDAERVVVTGYQIARQLDPSVPEADIVTLHAVMAQWELDRGRA